MKPEGTNIATDKPESIDRKPGMLFRGPVFRRRLLVAALLSMLIIVADYFAGNMSFPILDSSMGLGLHAYLSNYDKLDGGDNEMLAVNTAMDKAIAKAYDEFGDEAGHVAVTDREKLIEFLKIAEKANYRYIFLDIRFEDWLKTPHDSALYAAIARMPRVTYSRHRALDGMEPEYPGLKEKGAYADYRSVLNDGFSRYEFLQDGESSVALRLYHDLTGKTIEPTRWGGYRDSDGAICYNMQFVPFPMSVMMAYDQDGKIMYPLMGSQLMGKHSEEELIGMMKGKVVVIGDFNDDLHDTYIGSIPGPLLSYYAWRLLNRGGHKVNLWLQAFLFLLYTTVLYIMLLPDDKKRIKNPLLVLLLSLLGWGAVLWILKSALYWLFGLSFIVALPTIVFSTVTMIGELRKASNQNKANK